MTGIDIENRIIATQRPGAPADKPAVGPKGTQPSQPSFADVLSATLNGQATKANVKFSGHAQTRLASRNIVLSNDEITRLGHAITRAAAKGAKESLVLTDKAALVVSVANRTVITAVDKSSLKDNIFTNIDSAMII